MMMPRRRKLPKRRPWQKKPPKIDTIELSDSVAKHIDEGSHTAPATLEAVTYKADGSTKPSASAKAAPTLQVTA